MSNGECELNLNSLLDIVSVSYILAQVQHKLDHLYCVGSALEISVFRSPSPFSHHEMCKENILHFEPSAGQV